jgi:hypothetical protein
MIWVSMYIQSYTATLRFFLQYSYTLSRKQTLSFHSMPQSQWFDFTFIYHKTQSLNRPFIYLFLLHRTKKVITKQTLTHGRWRT